MKQYSLKFVPITKKIDDELYLISQDLACFSLDYFGHVIMPKTEEFFSQFNMSEEEKEFYYPYYIWWLIFCSRDCCPGNKTIYRQFLQTRRGKIRKKPLLEQTLSRWQYVNPGFFDIVYMASKRVFCLFDIFETGSFKIAYIPQYTFAEPDSNDMLAGIVLPLANGGYFSVIDLLIIPAAVKTSLILKLIHFYRHHKTTTNRDFFSEYYPEILKITINHMLENNIKRP